jgi:hypothetical protein
MLYQRVTAVMCMVVEIKGAATAARPSKYIDFQHASNKQQACG